MYKRRSHLIAGLLLVSLVVTLSAQSTESLMSNGNMLLNNGAYDQAVSKFRAVIERNPGSFEAWFNLGIAYLNWGKASNAVDAFKEAAGLNPRSTSAWSNLAVAYEHQGKI
ncbi:MAG: tetratricopeptide repeat protein, partial [Chitinivibrionales bacterium]